MTIKELQERKNKAASDIRTLADKQANWTQEDRDQWGKLNADYDAVSAEIKTERERLEASEAVQKRLAEIEAEQKAISNDRAIGVDHGRQREANPEAVAAKPDEARSLALQSWLRGGRGLSAEHRDACRALGIDPVAKEIELESRESRYYGQPAWLFGDGVHRCRELRVGLDVATSGAAKETIPQGFMAQLEYKTLAFGQVRQVCRVVSTPTGNTMPWPVVDDTGNVAVILAEATTIGTSVDPTFSAISFLAYKLSSKPVFVSSEILDDSAFNLGAELGNMIGERFGRGENVYFTTGTNSSQPQGIVAAAGTGVTSAVATVITADEILGLIHSLDPSYRSLPSTGFMMHDTALLYVRKLKDANGAYLWQPGMQAGVPDRLLGYPVAINQQMEPLVSNLPVTAKKHLLFSAMEKYVIRDAASLRFYRLEERYRDTDQTAFIAFKRVDGRTLNAAAHKVLLQA